MKHKHAVKSCLPSGSNENTRNAVETAIGREKQEKTTSWEATQKQKNPGIPKWVDK